MGVLGITPFLYRTCPHVFSRLPDRFRSLRGKTVVIDGTLVTQRLHFAPMPHPHRHIIGWHRILSELSDSDVHAICVFDGQHRTAAKAREVQRRRESRRIDAVRGSIERARLHRLQKLIRLLSHYRSLPSTDRQRLNNALTGIRSTHGLLDAHVSGSALLASTTTPFHFPSLSVAPQSDHILPPTQLSRFLPHPGIDTHDLHDALYSATTTSRSEPHCMLPSAHLGDVTDSITVNEFGSCDLSDVPCDDIFQSFPFVHWNSAVQPTPPTSYPLPDSVESFQSELSSLYCEYSQCFTQLTNITSSFETPEIVVQQQNDNSTSVDFPDGIDSPIEYAMSKQQLKMTFDEGHIWSYLSAPSSDGPPPETESALMALVERSVIISQSYQRRSSSPTSKTYEECKELSRAMGVPCIDSSGPFEAEALACALVTHGHADYVVSEDTDVLVYEAPMLRGITARESPIVVVHGGDIRATLQLDRASYVDFALLLGTDFSQRIKNVGPNRALKFIREHGSIERVVEQESKYPPRMPVVDYLAQVGLARHVFQNLPPLPDSGLLHQSKYNPDAVLEIIQRYKLHRMLPGAWDTQSALAGNYFGDDPSLR